MSCSKCKRSCRASLLCEACEKREWAMFEELGKAASQRTSDTLFDSLLTPDSGFSATAATNGPSPIASAMPVGQSLVKSLRELSEKFNTVPFRPAYLVIPPESLSQIPMVTMFNSPDFDTQLKFKVMMDYNVKLMSNAMMIPRSLLYGDIGGSDAYVPPVVWKGVQSPAKPSAWIWCVVVAFLGWLLCAAAGVL